MLDRTLPPEIKNAVDFSFKLPPVETWTLDNGVKVYALHAGQEEVVQLEWVFMAGNSCEKENLVAAATNFLLKNGTSRHSAYQINEHFEYFGSYVNRNCFNETSNIILHSLSKHLHELLPLVQELMTDAQFPQEELDIFVQNSKQRLSVNLLKCDFVANREIDVLIYGADHPYGRYSTEAAMDALRREQLLEFYDTWYRNGSCVLFVAGQLPPDLFGMLNRYFGQLPLKPADIHPAPPLPLPDKLLHPRQKKIVNDPDGVQGAIRLARHFPNRHHPDFQGVQVLNTVFGGFFGSRLMSNIREEKGYTYGIFSYLQNHIEQSAWMVSTEAGRDVCEAAITEVYKEMELLRQEPVDEEELLLVQNYLLGSILGDLDGPFQIINRWKTYVLAGVDDRYFYSAIEEIKTITPKRLQQLANQYLQPDLFYELLVI